MRLRWRKAKRRAPVVAGVVVRHSIRIGRVLPGISGPILASIGLGMIYKPLFFIALGAVLVLFDRRIT